MNSIEFVNDAEAVRWVFGVSGESGDTTALEPVSILAKRGGAPLFGVVYRPHGPGVYQGIVRADSSQRFRKSDVLPQIFAFAFDTLGAERLIGFVPAAFKGARRLNRNVGFRQIGVHRSGGRTLIIFEMTREECPWIKEIVS